MQFFLELDSRQAMIHFYKSGGGRCFVDLRQLTGMFTEVLHYLVPGVGTFAESWAGLIWPGWRHIMCTPTHFSPTLFSCLTGYLVSITSHWSQEFQMQIVTAKSSFSTKFWKRLVLKISWARCFLLATYEWTVKFVTEYLTKTTVCICMQYISQTICQIKALLSRINGRVNENYSRPSLPMRLPRKPVMVTELRPHYNQDFGLKQTLGLFSEYRVRVRFCYCEPTEHKLCRIAFIFNSNYEFQKPLTF